MIFVEATLFFDDCCVCVFSVDLPTTPVFRQLLVCDVSLLLLFHSQLSYILYHVFV